MVMAMQTGEFKRRLSKLRRRYKIAATVRGMLLMLTELVGCFLLLMLVDWVYDLPGTAMMVLWAAAARRRDSQMWPSSRPRIESATGSFESSPSTSTE